MDLKNAQKQVREFHETFDLNVAETPGNITRDVFRRRYKLIFEELNEYMDAVVNDDIVAVADAIADMLYVVLGTAVEHGIDIAPVFEEVHRSNMRKANGYKNEYGKFVKPDTYSPANIGPLIETQLRK